MHVELLMQMLELIPGPPLPTSRGPATTPATPASATTLSNFSGLLLGRRAQHRRQPRARRATS
jgi:hypothetical protein